jgi:hypothetical protein
VFAPSESALNLAPDERVVGEVSALRPWAGDEPEKPRLMTEYVIEVVIPQRGGRREHRRERKRRAA